MEYIKSKQEAREDVPEAVQDVKLLRTRAG